MNKLHSKQTFDVAHWTSAFAGKADMMSVLMLVLLFHSIKWLEIVWSREERQAVNLTFAGMRADRSRAAWCFPQRQTVDLNKLEETRSQVVLSKCRNENERRVLVKSLVDGGRWRLLFWLILEKVFQHACGQICDISPSAEEDGSQKSGPQFIQVRSGALLSRPSTWRCPAVTATAAWRIVASNRPNNLAQKRKDMNVNDMWWI